MAFYRDMFARRAYNMGNGFVYIFLQYISGYIYIYRPCYIKKKTFIHVESEGYRKKKRRKTVKFTVYAYVRGTSCRNHGHRYNNIYLYVLMYS